MQSHESETLLARARRDEGTMTSIGTIASFYGQGRKVWAELRYASRYGRPTTQRNEACLSFKFLIYHPTENP